MFVYAIFYALFCSESNIIYQVALFLTDRFLIELSPFSEPNVTF
jgi:hypothetical protein